MIYRIMVRCSLTENLTSGDVAQVTGLFGDNVRAMICGLDTVHVWAELGMGQEKLEEYLRTLERVLGFEFKVARLAPDLSDQLEAAATRINDHDYLGHVVTARDLDLVSTAMVEDYKNVAAVLDLVFGKE